MVLISIGRQRLPMPMPMLMIPYPRFSLFSSFVIFHSRLLAFCLDVCMDGWMDLGASAITVCILSRNYGSRKIMGSMNE